MSDRLRAERLLDAGDKQGAVVALMQASRRTPDDATLHAWVASLLNDLGQHDGAVGAGLLAVSLAPRDARAHSELGRAFFLGGQVEAALQPCARAVVLAPDNLGAMVNFGAVLFTLGRHVQALDAGREAVALDPRHFQARANLALALEAVGRLDEAEAQSRIALSLDPANPAARHNLAGLRLSRGKLDAESWALYEARLELTPASRALAAVPCWDGGDVAGKTVLLHAEQGFGDVIQFVRYAPLLAARGARVVVAVPAPLVRLMQGAAGVDEVVQAGGALPRFDVFCPVAGLPGAFRTTLPAIPPPTRFTVRASPRQGAGPLRVGLVWAGNPGFVHDRLRSIGADAFRVLAGVEGVEFHTLQKDGAPPFPMQDRMGAVTDFQDTAALVAGLDLVIAVDTAVAHLAASMGKPVWLLSRFMGCWRWLREREDSPWYPTVRLFRQRRAGDWAAVLTEVRAALDGLAASR